MNINININNYYITSKRRHHENWLCVQAVLNLSAIGLGLYTLITSGRAFPLLYGSIYGRSRFMFHGPGTIIITQRVKVGVARIFVQLRANIFAKQ